MIEPSWRGRRVSVRRVVERGADGRLLQGDVVGELVGLDEQTAVIDSRAGLVEVPLALVVLAKLVAPSTADELALERVVADSWRAADVGELDGWRLRANDGFTQRANSVLPLGQLRMPVDEALAAARSWYEQRGLPLRFRLPIEARRLLDAELGERGFEPSGDVAVLVTTLTRPIAGPNPPVRLDPSPDDGWMSVFRGGSAPGAIARELLERHDDVTFASLRLDGRTVAVARGTREAGWLTITSVEVDPGYRRRGLGSRVIDTLEAWGHAHGIHRAVLEVERANTPALALYEARGWWQHHDYRYRVETS